MLALLALCACAPPLDSQAQTAPQGSLFAATPSQQWRLLPALREISGLAVSADGRVFTHDDERAVIYEIDAAQGRLITSFAVGDPIATGDFEGIAITPAGDFHLITAGGLLYRFRQGGGSAHVQFDVVDTRLGSVCEIEGLAYFASEDSLIIACKTAHDRAMRDTVLLYFWSLGGAARRAVVWLSVPEDALTAATGGRHFRPSSVEIDPVSGRILLLSAFDGAFAELSRDGAILAARALGPGHAQPEGLTVTRGGGLLVADEARGRDGAALLSRYDRVP